MNTEANLEAVSQFWFHEIDPKKHFLKDADFDTLIASRFGNLVDAIIKNPNSFSSDSPERRLSLILATDQLTRNIYRNSPKAFAGDEVAISITFHAIKMNDLALWENAKRRSFLLMPMMHSEILGIQEASLPLFKKYTLDGTYQYAVRHHDIIKRFGRFPHRNEILSRDSTQEELEFLNTRGSSF